jgi:hypothetical protein
MRRSYVAPSLPVSCRRPIRNSCRQSPKCRRARPPRSFRNSAVGHAGGAHISLLLRDVGSANGIAVAGGIVRGPGRAPIKAGLCTVGQTLSPRVSKWETANIFLPLGGAAVSPLRYSGKNDGRLQPPRCPPWSLHSAAIRDTVATSSPPPHSRNGTFSNPTEWHLCLG